MKNRSKDRNLKQKRGHNDYMRQPQQQSDSLRQPGSEDDDSGTRQQGGWYDN